MHKIIRKITLPIIFLISFAGCLPNPCPNQTNYSGNLHLKIYLAEQTNFTMKSIASDIVRLTVKMDLEDGELTKTTDVDYSGNNQEISISDLYPGKWQVTVTGIDKNNSPIFAGSAIAVIESGVNCDLQIQIKPAPGRLKVTFNASQIPGFGTTVTTGTLYIYGAKDQTSAMVMNGLYLSTEVAVAEGTVQIRIAVPNVSKAIYISPYYTLNIQAGNLCTVNIGADGTIHIAGTIDSTPATPGGFNATYNKDTGIVSLNWDKGADSDLQGYRLYRTNSEGRFTMITTFDKDVINYNNTVTSSNFFNNRLGYAISSYDAGGNESFWSNPIYFQK